MFIDDPVFPLTASFGHQLGPEWQTDVVRTNSGAESRNQNWEQPLQRGKISFDARSAGNIVPVRKWFYIVAGRERGFRVRDAADYIVPDAAGDGVLAEVEADTSSAVYQLFKRYELPMVNGSGSEYFDRKITKVEVGTFALYDGVTLKASPGDYLIDEDAGLVTALFTPAGVLSWRGQFHVPVRFDSDHNPIDIINRNLAEGYIQGTSDLSIVELRL